MNNFDFESFALGVVLTCFFAWTIYITYTHGVSVGLEDVL